MPRQVTDEEYSFLQGRRQVADFVESIYNDPQLTREAKALIKKKYPNLQIPDYDIETRVEARFDKERKEREDREQAVKRQEEEARFAKLRKDTQDKHHFTDEAMTRLEKMMVDRNIGDYEAAAMLMVSKEPKPISNTGDWDNTRWHHDRQDGFADIAKDPEAWGRNQIMGAIARDQERARNGG
jgi:hypothetical protein